MFANDGEGKDVQGSRAALIAAVRRGSPLRVNWSESSAKEGWSVEEFANAGFANVMGGREVVVQLEPGMIQSHYTDASKAGIGSPLRDWIAMISTTGLFEAVMVDRQSSRVLRKLVQRTRVNWYVHAPPAECDGRHEVLPDAEQRNRFVEDKRFVVTVVPNLDAGRLRTGVFQYKTLVNAEPAGEMTVEIQGSGDNYVFSNLVNGSFAQSWRAVVNRRFAPKSATLSVGEGPSKRVNFDLTYQGTQVTGTAMTSSGTTEAIHATVPEGCLDQRVDWAAVMALPDYSVGSETRLQVFDPKTQASNVTVRVVETGLTRVPAGLFRTVRIDYTIEKSGRLDRFTTYVTKDEPRFLVREDFPDGSVIELVSSAPAK